MVAYTDQLGRWRMNIAKSGKMHYFIIFFHQYYLAVEFVKSMLVKYQLSGSLCGMVNAQHVEPEIHQENFLKMMRDFKSNNQVEIYFAQGRRRERKVLFGSKKVCTKAMGL